MKLTRLVCFLSLILVLGCSSTKSTTNLLSNEPFATRQYYQIKIYSFETEEQQQITESYLEKAYLPALKRQNIGPVGVFKPRDDQQDSLMRLYVLLPLATPTQLVDMDNKLGQDKAYLAAGKTYLEAVHDQPPYRRMESILLWAFEDMPVMKTPDLDSPRADRIYELRSYESATEADHINKVDMFNAGGEVKLFDDLGFNAVFYGSVISGPKMPNLMYMTTHATQAARDANWKTFVDSPVWKDLSSQPKYQNNVSHIDIYFLYPTAYSDY